MMGASSMIATMLFGVLGFLIPIGVLALCVHALYVALTRPSHAAPVPACERCRYPVAGLTQMGCPECGSDLRMSGIITPAMEMRRRGGLVGAITSWTILCCIAAYCLFMVVMISGVTAGMAGGGATTTMASTSLTPNSGGYMIAVAAMKQAPGTMIQADSTALMLSTQSSTSGRFTTSTAPSIAVRWEWADKSGLVNTLTSPPTRADVFAWMSDAGIDTTATSANAEADEIVAILTAAPGTTPSAPVNSAFKYSATNVTNIPSPAGLFQGFSQALLGAAFILVVYAMGIVFIVMRRNKLLREYGVSKPPPRRLASVYNPPAAQTAPEFTG